MQLKSFVFHFDECSWIGDNFILVNSENRVPFLFFVDFKLLPVEKKVKAGAYCHTFSRWLNAVKYYLNETKKQNAYMYDKILFIPKRQPSIASNKYLKYNFHPIKLQTNFKTVRCAVNSTFVKYFNDAKLICHCTAHFHFRVSTEE